MGRSASSSKEGLNRGAWTAEEDQILRDYISVHGEGKWRKLPERAGLNRCGKSCRLRWLNYLRPDIKRGNISQDEEDLIIRLHRLLGNRWSLIAGRLPGRTDNEIKNYWNTILCKKVRDRHTTTSTTSRTEKNTQKAMPREVTPSPSLSPSNHEPNSQVFRTKSLVVYPPPQSSTPSLHNNSKEPELHEAYAGPSLLVDDEAAINVSASNNHNMMEAGVYDNDMLSFRSEEKELPTTDLLFDFGIGEGEGGLCDLLNSDFNSDICDFGYNNYSGEDLLLPFWDKPLLSSHHEILEDRTQSNFCDGTNVIPNNFHSFTPFL